MTNYKLRAECLVDIERAHKIVPMQVMHIRKEEMYPDVDLEFECDLGLDEIKRLLACVEDGHVMLETVAHAEHYTGERVEYRPYPPMRMLPA